MAWCLPTFEHRQVCAGTRTGFKYFQELISLPAESELKQISARETAFTHCIALQGKNSQNKNRQQQTHKLTSKAKAGMVYGCSKWCCSLHWKDSYRCHSTNYTVATLCFLHVCVLHARQHQTSPSWAPRCGSRIWIASSGWAHLSCEYHFHQAQASSSPCIPNASLSGHQESIT